MGDDAAEGRGTSAPDGAAQAAIVAAVDGYRPKKVPPQRWETVAAAARAAMLAFGPPSPRWLSTHGGVVVRYCLWVSSVSDGGPPAVLPVDALTAPGLVDRYLREGLDAPEPTVATARWVLRRAVGNLAGQDRPPVLAHKTLQAPYSDAECAALVELATHQPTAGRRRAVAAVVALGLGAGLDARDQRLVTRADVVEVTAGGRRALAVQVPGQRARRVVVRPAYVPLLRAAVAGHAAEGKPADGLLHGVSAERTNVVSAVAESAVDARGRPVELSAARMRTTWLRAMLMAQVGLPVLLRAAGLSTARSLVEVLQFCDPPSDEEVDAAIAAAGGL